MISNLAQYEADLDSLIRKGDLLAMSLEFETLPHEAREALEKQLGDKAKVEKFVRNLPEFSKEYQSWYSEAKVLIRQLLPDRLDDFVRHYEKPKPRKDITFENYRIEDALQGLTITRGYEKKKLAGPEASIPHFRQQLAIVRSVKRRFESSLLDIQQLVQADLFDSELDAAQALAKAGHLRAAGVLAGVVLEAHLAQVCKNHKVTIRKKNPSIGDFVEALKGADVIDVPQWRSIQHLADVRNVCGHKKEREPDREEVESMIVGVTKTVKTLF